MTSPGAGGHLLECQPTCSNLDHSIFYSVHIHTMAEQVSGEAVAQAQEVAEKGPEGAKSGGDGSVKSDGHSANGGEEPDSTTEDPPPAAAEGGKAGPLEEGKVPPAEEEAEEGKAEATGDKDKPEPAVEEGEARPAEETPQVSPLEGKVIRQVEVRRKLRKVFK